MNFEAMTVFKRVFFDSSPFIYLVENHPKYYLTVANFVSDSIQENRLLFTSVVSISEIFVKPYRDNDLLLLKDFNEALESLNFTVAAIDFKIADLSATLRAKYPFLKGLDSLQIAAALNLQCSTFLTNDKRLKQITELEILLIDNLQNDTSRL